MKKITCLVLALITICMSLTSCGAGGDTNMHKIMTAMHKDKVILASAYSDEADCYEYKSLPELPYHNRWDNVDYDSTEAWADNVYYRHHIVFNANRVEIRQDNYAKEIKTNIYWNAKDNTIAIKLYSAYSYKGWNTDAKDPQNHGFAVDDGFSVAAVQDDEDPKIVFDMNVYYEKGKFELSDATYDINSFKFNNPGEIVGCEDMFLSDMVDLLNDALAGLNGVYTAKGYPIK